MRTPFHGEAQFRHIYVPLPSWEHRTLHSSNIKRPEWYKVTEREGRSMLKNEYHHRSEVQPPNSKPSITVEHTELNFLSALWRMFRNNVWKRALELLSTGPKDLSFPQPHWGGRHFHSCEYGQRFIRPRHEGHFFFFEAWSLLNLSRPPDGRPTILWLI
jgi:hypothetical protein